MSTTPCVKCGKLRVEVRDTRYVKEGPLTEHPYLRRRRVCLKCKHRWTTVEIPVVKLPGEHRTKLFSVLEVKARKEVRALILKFAKTL